MRELTHLSKQKVLVFNWFARTVQCAE